MESMMKILRKSIIETIHHVLLSTGSDQPVNEEIIPFPTQIPFNEDEDGELELTMYDVLIHATWFKESATWELSWDWEA